MFRILVLMLSLAAISACSSGGSSGGSNNDGANTKPEQKPLTANAGVDQTVIAGEKVTVTSDVKVANAGAGSTITGSTVTISSGTGEFQVIGSSSNPSDIVKLI